MTQNQIINTYFEWLCDLVYGERYSKQVSYDKLLTYLHCTEFTYLIPLDENRAEDGIEMRYRYALALGYDPLDTFEITNMLSGPCSVLEMMIALALRCEEETMDDAAMGNRSGQWFWGMIVNLGLGSMTDKRFDRDFVKESVDRFLKREYDPDGSGGLFTVRDCHRDLREVEIWYQLNWYLDSIT